jgi:hypothetical protein
MLQTASRLLPELPLGRPATRADFFRPIDLEVFSSGEQPAHRLYV